jgi:hypothetical protein
MPWLWIPYINVVLGIWLIVSPFILGIDPNVTLPSIVIGIVIVFVSFLTWTGTYLMQSAMWAWISWAAVLFGLGAIALPFVFGLGQDAMTSYVITGLVVAIVGFLHWLYTLVVRPARMV